MTAMLSPALSLRRRTPNVLYLSLTRRGISSSSSCGRVGGSYKTRMLSSSVSSVPSYSNEIGGGVEDECLAAISYIEEKTTSV